MNTGYSAMPWYCIGGPAAALQAATGSTYFGCQGADHSLFWAVDNGTGWSVLGDVGNYLIGGPAVAAATVAPEWVAENISQGVWLYTITGGWTDLGGVASGGVGAVALN